MAAAANIQQFVAALLLLPLEFILN